jgi:peptidyl-prolyl cis-trans isomerase D
MTMLDGMRRHKGWLKWSLGIVVVSFVVLYIPSFLNPAGVGAAPNSVIASVNGRDITVATYQRAFQMQVSQLQSAYGGAVNDQLIRQLGIPQRVVQQLVDEEAVVAEAERLGIIVTDAELRERIVRMPGLQENGQFIGDAKYRQVLQMQRPPMRPADFEAQLRRQLVAEKLQGALTAWATVSESEVDEAYRNRNEKVKLELAVLKADQFRAGIEPTDAEVTARFEGNKDAYRQPEKRRVRYLQIDAESLRSSMTATPAEVEARYRQNIQMYSTPEQVRASHILFKVDGKDEAAVRKQAEAVLARLKGGADFAAMSTQYSEDDVAKAQGGDLDFFGRNAMAKEFEDAAWALEVGQTSDVVKSSFGLHIIKLTDKRAATTRTLDEVRTQLEEQIKMEKAQAEATRIADEIAPQIDDPSDLDTVARARGLSVGDSGLFTREEPLAGLGFAPAVAAEAFTLEQGKVSGLLRTNQGLAFIALAEIKPSAIPTLDEVRSQVREDVVRLKAVEIARARAATMAAQSGRGSFAAAAKAAGVDVKTTDLIARGAPLPEVGISGAVDDVVFGLKQGQTSSPIATTDAVVVARVAERTDVSPADMATARPALRDELLQNRRADFFAAYMTRAKEQMQVTYNNNTLQTLLGPG